MGKSRNGILGNWWGRTGNVVARRSQGRSIYAVYQPQVSNPNTLAQRTQRQKFGLLASMTSKIGPWVAETFKTLDGYNVGVPYSAFVGMNLRNELVFSGTYPNIQIDFQQLAVSYGNVPLPTSIAAEANDHTVGVTWADNTSDMGAEATDVAMLLVYNETKKRAVATVDGSTRSTRRIECSYSMSWEGDTLQAWLVMKRADNSDYSETYYLGDFEG